MGELSVQNTKPKAQIITISGKISSGKNTFANTFKEYCKTLYEKSVFIVKYDEFVKFISKKELDGLNLDLIRQNNPLILSHIVAKGLSLLKDSFDYILIVDCKNKFETDVWKDYNFSTISVNIRKSDYDDSPYFINYDFDYELLNDATLGAFEKFIEEFCDVLESREEILN
jgi:hypothetical protein